MNRARVITEGALEEKTVDVGLGRPVWAMGLMSGTSLDGVDAAMLLTDGETISDFGVSAFLPYREGDLRSVTQVWRDWERFRPPERDEDAITLAEATQEVTALHGMAVSHLLANETPAPVLVGFHGQTVAHAPDAGWTWQLGDGDALARAVNRPVVWDFRSSDMKAGGQGAPLAPFYHFALSKWIGAEAPVAFLNLGGVGNVTWVDPVKETPEEEGALLAFDTGPANALINDWMMSASGVPMDRDGAAAAEGRVHAERLSSNFGRAYRAKPGPKSLDRNDFHGVLGAMEGLSVEDGAATLTRFTADCVAESVRHMPSPPSRWLVCGGGRLNPVMMRMLSDRLAAPVEPVEAVGLDGDMLEAQAFAYLAVRVLRGLPTSAPSTTGCKAPVSGGRISYPT